MYCDMVGAGSFTCQNNVDTISFNPGDTFDIAIGQTPGFAKPDKTTTVRFTALYTGTP
jgi:hypothetical protein